MRVMPKAAGTGTLITLATNTSAANTAVKVTRYTVLLLFPMMSIFFLKT